VFENRVLRRKFGPKSEKVSRQGVYYIKRNSLICTFRKYCYDEIEGKSQGSSVGIGSGYELDDRGSGVRFQEGAGNLFLQHRIQIGSGAHSASYPMYTGGTFPGCIEAGL
jgi:hypothetical protein